VYVAAPPAVKVATCPVQIVGEVTVTSNEEATVTVAIAVEVQPLDVPVTVYEVVVAGVDVAVVTPVTVTPAVQAYVVAPPAVNVAVPPGQIVGEFTVVTGNGFTVIV
jgi:hypothetical protein